MSSAEPPQPPRQASPATPPQEGNVLMQTLFREGMLARPYRLHKFDGASGFVRAERYFREGMWGC